MKLKTTFKDSFAYMLLIARWFCTLWSSVKRNALDIEYIFVELDNAASVNDVATNQTRKLLPINYIS